MKKYFRAVVEVKKEPWLVDLEVWLIQADSYSQAENKLFDWNENDEKVINVRKLSIECYDGLLAGVSGIYWVLNAQVSRSTEGLLSESVKYLINTGNISSAIAFGLAYIQNTGLFKRWEILQVEKHSLNQVIV